MSRQIHYCKCGVEIFDEMETCGRCNGQGSLAAPSGSLSWTQELPTKSGTYYWAYQWGTTEIEVCHVIADGHTVMAFDWHEDMRQETPVGMWQGWWAGPFDPPIPKWTENS